MTLKTELPTNSLLPLTTIQQQNQNILPTRIYRQLKYIPNDNVDIGLVEKPFQHTCLYHLQDCVVNGDYLAI